MAGDQIIYGKDPTKPMTAREWLGELATSAPHLFGESKGGGATTTTTTSAGGTPTTHKRAAEMDLQEKVAFIGKHGAAAWEQKIAKESSAASR